MNAFNYKKSLGLSRLSAAYGIRKKMMFTERSERVIALWLKKETYSKMYKMHSESTSGSHPHIQQVGEGIHVLDAERILFPELFEQI